MKTWTLILISILLGIGAGGPAAAGPAGAASLEGLWTARIADDQVKLKLSIFEDEENSGEWSMSLSLKTSELTGLQFDKDHTFELRREAGVLSFTGKISGGRGSGSFEFAAVSGEHQSGVSSKSRGFGLYRNFDGAP
jgi:hypothetical protein